MRVCVLSLLCVTFTVLATGCGTQRLSTGPTLGITPIEPRIDAIVGQTLVIPVEIRGSIDPREPLTATLTDGRAVRAELHWISVLPEADRARGWLAPAGKWTATPGSADVRPPGVGVWAVVVRLPSDAYRQSLTIGGTRIALNWWPDPAGVAIATDPQTPSAIIAEPSEQLLAAIAEEARSPMRRWRHRLINGTLWAGARSPGEPFADPIVEALALQTEARWRAGLQRLRDADAELAREVEWRLACVIDVQGHPTPAWSEDQAELDTLRLDLLSPRVTTRERLVERALAWLASQPSGITWVVDDAGLRSGQGRMHPVIVGAANLTSKPLLASVFFEHDPGPMDLVPVPARSVADLHCVLAGDRAIPGVIERSWEAGPRGLSMGTSGLRIRARVGDAEARHDVMAPPLRAEPPGMLMSPLWADLTLSRWMSREAGAVVEVSPTAAMMHRHGFAGDSEGSPHGWSLFIECVIDETNVEHDMVRVWLGPRGAPRAVLRAGIDGEVIDELTGQTIEGARVVRERDRWTCALPITSNAIEADQTVLIAIERVLGGQRSAWPRAMLPWQIEPGRAAVDLSRWGELSARRE